MASIKDTERVADELEQLVNDMRTEMRNGPDFQRLVEIADSVSERADQAAEVFNTVNEALMGRIGDISDAATGGNSSRKSKSKSN